MTIFFLSSDLGYESQAVSLASNLNSSQKSRHDHFSKAVGTKHNDQGLKHDPRKINDTNRDASEALKVLKSLMSKTSEPYDPVESTEVEKNSLENGIKVNNQCFSIKGTKTDELIKELNARIAANDLPTSTPASAKTK